MRCGKMSLFYRTINLYILIKKYTYMLLYLWKWKNEDCVCEVNDCGLGRGSVGIL